jgi:hypothetical protein
VIGALGSLPPFGTARVVITVRADAAGYQVNTATITQDQADTQPGNNSASAGFLVDQAPVATDQFVTTPEDTGKVITLTASDPDGDSLTYGVISPPLHGSLTGSGANRTYTPEPNFHGQDSFTFRASDGQLSSDTATVFITIDSVNDPPVAYDQTVSTPEDTAKVLTLVATDADGDSLTYSVVSGPSHGTLSGSGASRTYSPAADYAGADSFTLRANDGAADSNTATVNISVTAVNDAPVARNDSYSGWQRCPLRVAANGVLGNDTDAEGSPLTAVLVEGPTRGSLTLNSDGSFLYTPNAGTTSDLFTYRASDGAAAGNLATVTLTLAVDTTPPAAAIGSVVTQSGPTLVYLPITVSDGQSGVVTVQLTTQSTNCVLLDPATGAQAAIGAALSYDPSVSSRSVRVVKLDPTRTARVELRLTDCAGNTTLVDPVIANLRIATGAKTVRRSFPGIPASEHYVTFQNGTPGLRSATLSVNGRTVSYGALRDGEARAFDIARYLHPGNDNMVSITGAGPAGASAMLTIGDQASASGKSLRATVIRAANTEFAP